MSIHPKGLCQWCATGADMHRCWEQRTPNEDNVVHPYCEVHARAIATIVNTGPPTLQEKAQ